MKAAILDTLGQPPRFGETAEPTIEGAEMIVEVQAASIKQLDRAIAAGTHYSSPKASALPVICGTDGVGRLPDGSSAYFWVDRRPFGAMAAYAPASLTVPLPIGLDPATACAIVNPGLAAWLPLAWRAHLQPGENVLIIGATGASGRLAVTAARLLGAGRVVACGRRQAVLDGLGADATIDLTQDSDALKAAFAAEVARGIGVVVDYIWGAPMEALIAALTTGDLHALDAGPDVRIVSVGAMAKPTITLPSAVLRGSRLSILGSGTANFPPVPEMQRFVAEVLARAATGEIGLATERVLLADVAEAWTRPSDPDKRLVLVP